ncbi:hypothetical protein FRC06_007782 [Ceratobasidium sp. 370]|nr:hypothetical protein FRC06_007782 [Ceratobasidium sp. 370]
MPICPCCGNNLDKRQVYWHLATFDDHFDLAMGDVSTDSTPGPGGESDAGDDRSSSADSGDNPPSANNSGPGNGSGLSAADDDMGYEYDPEIAQVHAHMDLGDAGPALPRLNPILELRWNVPVMFDDWPDEPPEVEPSDSGSESIGDEFVGEDWDPKYVERMEPPGFDPNDEPEFNDNELLAVLEARLGDMAEEEWLDMYSCIISKRDRKTLDLLATRLHTHFSRRTWDDLRYGICKELDIPSEFVAWCRLWILSGLDVTTSQEVD